MVVLFNWWHIFSDYHHNNDYNRLSLVGIPCIFGTMFFLLAYIVAMDRWRMLEAFKRMHSIRDFIIQLESEDELSFCR